MILGCHLSSAGGMHKALERAADFELQAVAMFVRDQRQWKAPPLSALAVKQFRDLRDKLGIRFVLAHGSYLLNLAGATWVRKLSITAMGDELDRSNRLGIDYYVFHPGSSGPEGCDAGVAKLADALNLLAGGQPAWKTKVLLETTAGTGSMLGARFEILAQILARLERPELFGMCLDTCHVFASGYDIRTPEAYARTMAELDRVIGRKRLYAMHINDSVKGLNSHLDRHAHIGQGELGLQTFANFIRDEQLADVPMILETPKGENKTHDECDLMNIATMRELERRVKTAMRAADPA